MTETIFKSPGIDITIEEKFGGWDYTIDILHGKSGYYSGGNNFPTKEKAIERAIARVKWRLARYSNIAGRKEFEEFCKEQQQLKIK